MEFLKIVKPVAGTRWVIADIHGCAMTLKRLVQDRISLGKEDHLYLLGDYINRGPDSCGVIDFILDLKSKDYQVFALRGNHEQMLIDFHQKEKTEEELSIPRLHRYKSLTNPNQKILPEYEYFFLNLPYYFELNDFLLSHAGFNFHHPYPFSDYDSMLWQRKAKPDVEKQKGKTIIHGHNIVTLSEIKQAIGLRDRIIPLDNGCYYGITKPIANGIYSNLCALNLDSYELIVQECIDTREKNNTDRI